MTVTPTQAPAPDIEALREVLYRDGIVGLPGALPPSWADELRADFDRAFAAARSYAEGTISRGPNRFYFAVPPERIRGFVALVTHPLVMALSAAVCGRGYQFVELAFDVPLRVPWTSRGIATSGCPPRPGSTAVSTRSRLTRPR